MPVFKSIVNIYLRGKMRKATKTVAKVTGVTAGLAGIEHGVFEILQKGKHAPSLMFASTGAPCDPAVSWNACEPAMSIISDFLIMGIISIALGISISIWSTFFLDRKGGGWFTILLSILLLLFGGGFFPPIIGLISGFSASSIQKQISQRKLNGFNRLMTKIWPWPLVYFSIWSFGQFLLGYFFNDFLKTNMLFFTLLFMVMLGFAIITANAQDRKLEYLK